MREAAQMRLLLVANGGADPKLWESKSRLEQQGFIVETAGEEDADPSVRTHSHDAVVLDLPLCRHDALDWLRKWREGGTRTPVLALLPPDKMSERIAMLDGGADGILTKPFEVDELLARLRALLRRSSPNKTPVHRVYDLEIDPNSRTVKRGGRNIRLTPREFALLQFLAHHRGKVVSRSMIFEHLYDQNTENNSNVVDVFIRYLRTKIDQGFEPRLILTRWGKGYLLRGESA
jgi:DNA-binding response OmpR family regulator